MIIDDASRPGIEKGAYITPYCEAVDGYRHGYYVDSPNPNKRGVRWTRSANHPPDPRCPACPPAADHPTRPGGGQGEGT